MKFCERLDFLISLTKVTNASLARYVSLDPSYICRFRSGERKPYPEADYFRAMAVYFTKKMTESYQIAALDELIGSSNMVVSAIGSREDIIFHWLSDDLTTNIPSIDSFLQHFGQTPSGQKNNSMRSEDSFVTKDDKGMQVFYGIKGKQEAVIGFLNNVINYPSPQTLYLFSDEETSWLTDDPIFTERWATLLHQILSRGNRMVIIHSVSRNLHEMIRAISQWVPLYLTGAITPYYYPRIRDGIFRRTLFVAAESCAVVSSSIGEETKHNANLFITDKKHIAAYQKEFEQYLLLCRPLMQIFTKADHASAFETLLSLEKASGDAILISLSISTLSMSEDMMKRILDRCTGIDAVQTFALHKRRVEEFQANIKKYIVTEFITLPDQQALIQEKIPVSLFYSSGPLPYYTKAEYATHLQSTLDLMSSEAGYRVILGQPLKSMNLLLSMKEHAGVFLGKLTESPISFGIHEPGLVASFWEYMEVQIRETPSENLLQDEVAKKIRQYLTSIEQL